MKEPQLSLLATGHVFQLPFPGLLIYLLSSMTSDTTPSLLAKVWNPSRAKQAAGTDGSVTLGSLAYCSQMN